MTEPQLSRANIIAPEMLSFAPCLRERFEAARPFKHVVVDGFFAEPFARALLDQFPQNDRTGELNEFGAPGIKVVHSDLPALGPVYRTAHAYFASPHFLQWMSDVTGIPALLYDPDNFGGGTHENLDGRDLRPHVDFNYHPTTNLHRRVNLIVYLNEGWEREWGGSIALHSDPRSPSNIVQEYEPLFNRAIIFETNERSWHGFDLISLPDDEKHRSRKSLSIYLYSRERPEEETHASHTTFFVPRAMPARFSAGRTLTESDVEELAQLMGQRDRLIALYQREQGVREEDSAQAARLRIELSELRAKLAVPTMGYVRPAGGASGLYDDGWSGAELRFAVRAERAVSAIEFRASVPQGVPDGTRFELTVGNRFVERAVVRDATVSVHALVEAPAGATLHVHARIAATANHKHLSLSADERDLGFRVECVTFEHNIH